MQLTVLGSGAACPPPGQNSSGYLIEDGDRRILLDCGHGVATALLVYRPDFDIDDIIITHMHPDHFIDVIPLRFRITREMAGHRSGPALHLPPGGAAALAAVLEASQFPADFCASTLNIREYDPQQTLPLGDVQASFAPAEHYIPAWSVRLEGSASLTYSGDTAPSEAVAELARGSDLFLCEATLNEPETGAVKGHVTPEQAAQLATAARAKSLLLTHFWFDADLDDALRRAQGAFRGPVDVASDGLSLRIGQDRPLALAE